MIKSAKKNAKVRVATASAKVTAAKKSVHKLITVSKASSAYIVAHAKARVVTVKRRTHRMVLHY